MRQSFLFLFFLTVIFETYISAQTIRDRVQQRQASKAGMEQENGRPPVYSDLYFWAAHPAKKDMSDSIPSFISNEKRDTLADVFFLHPTTYTKFNVNLPWNASLDDTAINNSTDRRTILFQSSAFNNCSRIFAPRYRQAHIKSYVMMNSEPSQVAFDLAYEDLKMAFQYYLNHENKGRPIIIASHSQGAMHAIRLLKEFFDGKPLQKQLVCAYIVGWQIKPDDFKSIPVGETANATGCYVGWRSYKKGEIDFFIQNEKGGSVCVNPVSWTTSTNETKPKQHKGGIWKDINKLIPGVISASIEPEHNILWVDAPEKDQDKFGSSRVKNYHVADYNLFWLDIRENAMLRVKTFLNKK